MQKHRPLSFLHTNTTVLHLGLWLGQIVPTSNISFTCAWTLSTIPGGILQNLSLKGSPSTTLTSCFAKSIQPNSPGSSEKMLWYLANRHWAAAWFLSEHPYRPDKSSCWKSTSILHSTNILVSWIPCISSNFSSPGGQFHWGHHNIHSYYLSNFNALGDSDWDRCQVFHYHCNLLAPRNHFSVHVHHTQAVRQVGSITPFQGLSHYIHIVSKEQGFHLAMYYFGWKSIYLFPLYHLDYPIQIGQIHCFICGSFSLNWKSWSPTCQQLGYAWSIQGNWQFISFTFLDHVDDLIDGGCIQSNLYLGSKNSRIWYD